MTRNVRGGGACDYYLDGVSVDSYPILSYKLFCRTYCRISNLLIFALRAVHLHPCTLTSLLFCIFITNLLNSSSPQGGREGEYQQDVSP